MRLVLTGGGTGGHVYPALALAEAFAADASFAPLVTTYVGSRDGIEARIVPPSGLALAFVRAAPFERGRPLALARTAWTNLVGFAQALGVLHRARPDALVATGGYVTFPVVAALRVVRALGRSRARIALLEPNAATGLTNRLLAPLVDEIWYALAPARPLRARECVVGTPVRARMREPLSAARARAEFDLAPDRTTVVVMGGSQGARSINDAVAAFVDAGMPARMQVLVVSGARDFESMRARIGARPDVRIVAYLDDPRAAYAAADLVVARAGASTLGELGATATPALLVPYPFATDDHQTHNARAYAAGGSARVVDDRELDGPRLARELAAALAPDALAAMRAAARARSAEDAAATIVARVKRWALTKSGRP